MNLAGNLASLCSSVTLSQCQSVLEFTFIASIKCSSVALWQSGKVCGYRYRANNKRLITLVKHVMSGRNAAVKRYAEPLFHFGSSLSMRCLSATCPIPGILSPFKDSTASPIKCHLADRVAPRCRSGKTYSSLLVFDVNGPPLQPAPRTDNWPIGSVKTTLSLCETLPSSSLIQALSSALIHVLDAQV